MYVGRKFTFLSYVLWTKYEVLVTFIVAIIACIMYDYFGFHKIGTSPYVGTVLGTTLAFVISFKNNVAYQRQTEAAKFYAEIESTSFSFCELLRFGIHGADPEQVTHYQYLFFKQHMAWLTTLRYQLRQARVWENLDDIGNTLFRKNKQSVPEYQMPLSEALLPYLPPEQISRIIAKPMESSHYCLCLQYDLLYQIIKDNYMVSTDLMGMFCKLLKQLATLQMEVLRIKNNPYPRGLSSITRYLRNIFLFVLPFSLLPEAIKVGFIFRVVPMAVGISWMFVCLEKVGENLMNPFEGGPNDIPITSISRRIEITMLESLGAIHLPEPTQPVNNILF